MVDVANFILTNAMNKILQTENKILQTENKILQTENKVYNTALIVFKRKLRVSTVFRNDGMCKYSSRQQLL